eukprot:scaffold2750_cov380-Prasinococcus_capsulatus_cf.AAC.1
MFHVVAPVRGYKTCPHAWHGSCPRQRSICRLGECLRARAACMLLAAIGRCSRRAWRGLVPMAWAPPTVSTYSGGARIIALVTALVGRLTGRSSLWLIPG